MKKKGKTHCGFLIFKFGSLVWTVLIRIKITCWIWNLIMYHNSICCSNGGRVVLPFSLLTVFSYVLWGPLWYLSESDLRLITSVYILLFHFNVYCYLEFTSSCILLFTCYSFHHKFESDDVLSLLCVIGTYNMILHPLITSGLILLLCNAIFRSAV